MIYKALVVFATNEMPVSLWQIEGDGYFKNKYTGPWCAGFLRKLDDDEQNLATRCIKTVGNEIHLFRINCCDLGHFGEIKEDIYSKYTCFSLCTILKIPFSRMYLVGYAPVIIPVLLQFPLKLCEAFGYH